MSESPGLILTALRAAFSPPCPSRRHPGAPAWDAKAGPRRAPAPAPPPPPARSPQPPGAGGANAGPEGRGVSDVQGLGLSSALPLGPPASRGWSGWRWAGFGRRSGGLLGRGVRGRRPEAPRIPWEGRAVAPSRSLRLRVQRLTDTPREDPSDRAETLFFFLNLSFLD